jgi:nucleoside-diphosphate-sugar epimerase
MERPILVTGSGGFIGRHLVARLREQGLRVRALVRRPEAAAPLAALGAEPIVGDLLDATTVGQATSGVRMVYHLAGRLFIPGIPMRDYEQLHVGATRALIEACAGLDRFESFVLCSTTGVHGPTEGKAACEDDAARPQNAYELTKVRAERIAAHRAGSLGVPLTIARPGLVYGPGDQHLLGFFRAIGGGYYRVIGSGSNRLHPIYVDDVVSGLQLSASAAHRGCRAYHLVGSQPVTIREFSDAVGVALGRPVPKMHLPTAVAWTMGAGLEVLPVPRRVLPLTRSRVRFLTQDRAYDGRRAFSELGFTPRVELGEGLARTVTWYRENGLL